MDQRIGAVVNPQSGAGDGLQRYRELTTIFSDATHSKYVTTRPRENEAATRDQAPGVDLLVAIGGDGTLRDVVDALVDEADPPPVFVVPAGRGNSSYRHLYGEQSWQSVARELRAGITAAPLTVGAVRATPPLEMEYFVLGFTAGLFRSAVTHARRFEILPGPLGYLLGVGRAVLGDEPVTATLAVDDETVFSGDARVLAVGGGRYRGRNFELFPESRPGDGRLHALAVEPTGLGASMDLLRRARRGHLHSHPRVHAASGTSVTITADSKLPVEVDGTPSPHAIGSADIEVLPDALTYAVPPGWAEERDRTEGSA